MLYDIIIIIEVTAKVSSNNMNFLNINE